MDTSIDNKNMREMTQKIISKIDNEDVRAEVICNLPEMSILMDSKQIKKIIEALLRFEDGKEALKRVWRNLINNSDRPKELIFALGQEDDIRKDMLDNIKYFFKYANTFNYAELAQEFSKLEGGNEKIIENFDEFMEGSINHFDYVIIPALQTKDGKIKVKKQFEELKNKILRSPYASEIQSFFNIIKSLKGIEGFEEIYEDYSFWAELYDDIDILEAKQETEKTDIQRNKFMADEISQMYGIEVRDDVSLDMKDILAFDAKYQEFIKILLSEDRKEKRLILEKVANGNKYKYKSAGTSSLTIQVDNQIAKLGSRKRKFEIPYHPRIMMPYFRKRYEDDTTLEVYNLGNTQSAKINDENLLEIYKELEKDGIVWTDARKENIVELISDNMLPDHIRGEDFNLFGFLDNPDYPTNNHVVLKAGDLVICDLDMLYVKGDTDIQIGLQDDIIRNYTKNKTKVKDEETLEI